MGPKDFEKNKKKIIDEQNAAIIRTLQLKKKKKKEKTKKVKSIYAFISRPKLKLVPPEEDTQP
jgi:hypothetical protein